MTNMLTKKDFQQLWIIKKKPQGGKRRARKLISYNSVTTL